MRDNVLIIAPDEAANAVAAALRKSLDVQVEIAGNRRAGLLSLRSADWSLVVLEESLACGDPEAADLLYSNAGSAMVIEVNFAITSAARAVRQVRASLIRLAQEKVQARTAAAAALRGELRSILSGLFLESQLALQQATPAQQGRLRNVVRLAGELRSRLPT